MTVFFKSVLMGVLRYGASLSNRASILMYHSVGDNRAFFTVDSDTFEKHMVYLSRHYRTIKLSDLLSKMSRGEDISRCVVITFDDGYVDNYINAFPVLRKYNIPCTIFLATDYIGKQMTNTEGISLPILTEEMLGDMLATGLVEYMPHSKTHKNFDKMSAVSVREEMVGSRQVVESLTGQKAPVFSFPRGIVSPHAFSILTSAGFEGAVTVEEGTVSVKDDVMTLKRNSIDSSTSLVQFKAKISTAIDRYVKFKTILKRLKLFS